MDDLSFHCKAPPRLMRESGKECGEVVSSQPIQCTSQAIVVQVLRRDPWTDQLLDRFVSKKLGHQVQATITKTQATLHHRQHGLTQGYAGMCLFIEAVEILDQPYLLTDASHDPQMIQTLHCKTRHADPFRREVARVSHASWESVKSIHPKNRSALQGTCGRWGEELHRIFYATRFLCRLDRLGYAHFRRWKLYGEEALARHPALIWLHGEALTIEHAETPLAKYGIEYQPDKKHFRNVPAAERYQTPYRSPQGHLWELDDKWWKLATKLPDYAPRIRRLVPSGARQDPLFLPDEAASS
jgi:hypothetical protein